MGTSIKMYLVIGAMHLNSGVIAIYNTLNGVPPITAVARE